MRVATERSRARALRSPLVARFGVRAFKTSMQIIEARVPQLSLLVQRYKSVRARLFSVLLNKLEESSARKLRLLAFAAARCDDFPLVRVLYFEFGGD